MALRVISFDWGDTLMRVLPGREGPMCHWPEVAAVPGARELLATLDRIGGYRLALLSGAAESTEAEVRAALDRVDLGRYFDQDAIVLAGRLGVPKTDPEFYGQAMDLLGCLPREALMVGDSFPADVVAAKAAGLWAAWYNPGGLSIPESAAAAPDVIISDLRALAVVVRRLGHAP